MRYLVLFGFIGTGMLAGCVAVGPTRAEYRELLRQCRDANREHLRLYRAEVEACADAKAAHAEQEHGAAEMGLGGY